MPNSDPRDTSDSFARQSIQLLKEYTARLLKLRDQILASCENARKQDEAAHYFHREKIGYLRMEFARNSKVYTKLGHKVSQWLQHAAEPRPELQLELEVRLQDLEDQLQGMETLFDSGFVP